MIDIADSNPATSKVVLITVLDRVRNHVTGFLREDSIPRDPAHLERFRAPVEVALMVAPVSRILARGNGITNLVNIDLGMAVLKQIISSE